MSGKLSAGRKLLTSKVSNNHHDGYDETLEFKILNCSNLDGNNNKFYCLEIQKNPINNRLRLFSHYGRVGSSHVFEVRDKWKETKDFLTEDDLEIIQKEFNSIIKKKLRGKSTKRPDGSVVRENYELVEVSIPKVGSVNIYGKNFDTTTDSIPKKISNKKSTSLDFNVSRVVDQIIEENIHNVTSATSIQYSNGRYETPLGPVTIDHINKARLPLNEIKELIQNNSTDQEELKKQNNLYFSLIPHSFGRKITSEDWISSNDKLSDEYDILDQLESATKLGSNIIAEHNILESLKVKMVPSSHREFVRLNNKFESTRARNHNNLLNWKVKYIYDLVLENERKRYNNRNINGREVELFHGSRNCNILSIVSSGLMIPRVAAHGRMFGDGIYAAPASTKALNYSTGFWGGKNKYPNAFIFVVKFSLGNEYNPTSSLWNGPPSGYNSIWAVAKDAGLYNDEVIVYSTEQCSITHIIELEQN